MAGFTPDQFAQVPPKALGGFNFEQFEALASEAFGGFQPGHIKQMPKDFFAEFDPQSFQALAPEAIRVQTQELWSPATRCDGWSSGGSIV